ncbi:hypothetical protein Tco_0990600 [Tanacetum coccineum]|uniref:Uncharacterized protein n=1 Tax=Tanacetum coccineum TaxID=301880 RepID=A0ABQ5EWX0_9ASTR
MNEQAANKKKEQKAESVHEEVKKEEGAKKKKLGTRRKLKVKRRKYTSGLTREDDDLKMCLHIDPNEDKLIDVEILDHQYPIRFFRTLMGVLSIFDREDLKAVYELVMKKYQDEIPKGFDKMLWGDLMIINGLVIHMLVENRYPLTKEVLSQMLDLKLETEEESTMALELIKFVKQQLEEFEDSDDDDLAKSDHEEAERV